VKGLLQTSMEVGRERARAGDDPCKWGVGRGLERKESKGRQKIISVEKGGDKKKGKDRTGAPLNLKGPYLHKTRTCERVVMKRKEAGAPHRASEGQGKEKKIILHQGGNWTKPQPTGKGGTFEGEKIRFLNRSPQEGEKTYVLLLKGIPWRTIKYAVQSKGKGTSGKGNWRRIISKGKEGQKGTPFDEGQGQNGTGHCDLSSVRGEKSTGKQGKVKTRASFQ